MENQIALLKFIFFLVFPIIAIIYLIMMLDEVVDWIVFPENVEIGSESALSMLGFRGDKRMVYYNIYKPKGWYRCIRIIFFFIFPLTRWLHKRFINSGSCLLVFYYYAGQEVRFEK